MRYALDGTTASVVRKYFSVAILIIAACAQSTGLAWPFDSVLPRGLSLWWLQLTGLAVLVIAVDASQTPGIAARKAWLFSTIWLSTTFWWLFVALHTYGGLPSLLAILAVVGLAAALAIYYALAIFAWHRLVAVESNRGLKSVLVFAIVWLMAELARGTWLTGFGWGAIGYAHLDGPLATYLPYVGSYGVTAIAAGLSALWGYAWIQKRWLHATMVTVAILSPAAIPESLTTWTNPSGVLRVTLLQGNIPQDEKFEPGSGVPLALNWYRQAILASDDALVVAPETAIPLLRQQLPDGYWQEIAEHFQNSSTSALIGIPLGSFSEGYTNSVIGLGPDAPRNWQYDKHHLVPFGEFIPPLFKWFTDLMKIPLGDFKRGPTGQASLPVRGEQIAPNICYEDLYGEELATRFVNSAAAPTLLANLSNMGWFGDTVAVQQHLNISRVRALEFQRPFVRATNTGATAFLSYRGEVLSMLPPQTRGVLRGEVQGRTGLTPFAWWSSRWGTWPLWLTSLLVLIWACRGRGGRAGAVSRET